MAGIYDYLNLYATGGPLAGDTAGAYGETMAAYLPGGGLFYGEDGTGGLGNAGGSGGGGDRSFEFSDPIRKYSPLANFDPVLKSIGGFVDGLFGGGGDRAPLWQRLARREVSQGNAVLAAYNALYEPTLAITRRGAADYGDLYRRAANETLAHDILSSTTTRRADIQDYNALGPELLAGRRRADPLFGQAYEQASRDMTEANADLPAAVRRDISQNVLRGLNSRGMSLSPTGIYEEALALTMGGEQFRNQRRSQAFSEAESLLGIYGDPFQAITGRVSHPAPQGANIQSPNYADFTNDLFSYGVNAEIQGRNVASANRASNKAMAGELIGSMLRGAGSFASLCWVAREVFGPTDARWKRFRGWLLTMAPARFRKWYLEHGEEYAEKLKSRPKTRQRMRKLMVQCISQLHALNPAQAH